MIDICFGDSECGMLKHALRKTKDGVTFPFRALEMGEISSENFIEARKAWIDVFFSACTAVERKKILDEEIDRFNAIIRAAKNNELLRIWCATTPCAKSGFYHLIYNLQGINCPILVIDLPESFVNGSMEDKDHSWGELTPKEMELGVLFQRELTIEERNEISKKWERLAKENAKLRLNINGELTSVPEDFLDREIMNYAPNGEFTMGRLIGMMLGYCPHGISDTFVAIRIEALIEKNELIVVKRARKKENYYSNTVLHRSRELTDADYHFEVICEDEFDSGLGEFLTDDNAK